MAATYEPIATYTATGNISDYTFSSIPSTYTDLVIISNGYGDTQSGFGIYFNGDTTSNNYSFTRIEYFSSGPYSGNNSSAAGQTGAADSGASGGDPGTVQINIMNYASSSTYKYSLTRSTSEQLSQYLQLGVALWSSTSAINSIKVFPTAGGVFLTGFTVTLYGIKAA